MYDILLVDKCCRTLDTAVNEAYFALFSMGAHLTGMARSCLCASHAFFFHVLVFVLLLFLLVSGVGCVWFVIVVLPGLLY